MKIQATDNFNSQAVPNRAGQEDAFTKRLKSQIADVQKKMQELSSNQDMSMEEKMKKRQELQKQISDLNMQLRQHQIELRKEKMQQKQATEKDTKQKKDNEKADEDNAGLSEAGMRAVMSAESSIKQSKIQGNVATRMEDRAGVLKTEIKIGHGDVESKKEELADVEQKAMNAKASQFSTLGKAESELEGVSRAENDEDTMASTEKENVQEETREEKKKRAFDEDETKGKKVDVYI